MWAILKWWFCLEIMGVIGWPILMTLFPGLKDRGVSAARLVGMLLVAYPVWFLVHYGAVFSTNLVMMVCGCWLLLSLVLLVIAAVREKPEVSSGWIREALWSEAVWLIGLVCLLVLRSFNPEIEGMWRGGGSEKLMDLNFVNSILNSLAFPPRDNWLAGFPINYYYYGYYLAAVLIKLTGVLPHVGYNLMVVTVYAMAIQVMWGVLRNLGLKWYWSLLGIFLAWFSTNLKAPWLGLSLKENESIWILWRSSRVIDLATDRTINEYPWFSFLWGDLHGHLAGMPLQAGLLYLGTALAQQFRRIVWGQRIGAILLMTVVYGSLVVTNAWDLPAFAILFLCLPLMGIVQLRNGREIAGVAIAVLAVLAIVGGNHFLGLSPLWVWLALIVLSGLSLTFFSTKPSCQTGILAMLLMTMLAGVFLVLFRPFFMSFEPPTSGYNLVPLAMKTPYHLFLLIFGVFFGLLVVPLLSWLFFTGGGCLRNTDEPFGLEDNRMICPNWLRFGALVLLPLAISAGLAVFLHQQQLPWGKLFTPVFLLWWLGVALVSWFYLLWSGSESDASGQWISDRLVAVLLVLAIGMVLGCEFVAVKDFYGSSSLRLNTVFKFHLQAWIMLAVAVAYMLQRWFGWIACLPSFWGVVSWGLRGIVLALLIAGIAWTAIGSWFVAKAKCSNFENSMTLDGMAYAFREGRWVGERDLSADDARVMQWLLDQQRLDPDPRRLILETPGAPYSIFGRVATFTGIQTLIAVPNHEGIWNRGKSDAMAQIRNAEQVVRQIYSSNNFEKVRELMSQHGVTHVFWGTVEQREFGAAARKKFDHYMTSLFSSGDSAVYSGFKDNVEELILEELPKPQPLKNASVIQPGTVTWQEPRGLAIDASGCLYVANSKKGQIVCLSPEGDLLRILGEESTPPEAKLGSEYSGVGAVCVVPESGDVVVADTWNHRIVVYGPGGDYKREIKHNFWGPRGVVVLDGKIVVADTGNHRLVVCGLNGDLKRVVGSKGSAQDQMLEPVGLAVWQNSLFVADTGNSRVQVFGRDFRLQKSWNIHGWRDQVGTEPYMAVDAQGNLWLTDSPESRVHCLSADGKLIGIFGPEIAPLGMLRNAKGIAIHGDELLISDFGNQRVLRLPIPSLGADK